MNKASMLAALFVVATNHCMAASDGGTLFLNCDQAMNVINGGTPKDFNEIYQTGLCLGMVEGVVGALVIQGDSNPKYREVCPPDGGIRNDDATKAVMRYLYSHPEKANQDAAALVSQAIKTAYPCR